MFAPGPRAVGFTIVWPEGVIFRSMMTYHVQFLVLVLAGWVNRQQQDVIDYLQEENRVLRAGLPCSRAKTLDPGLGQDGNPVGQGRTLDQNVLGELRCGIPGLDSGLLGWPLFRRRTARSAPVLPFSANVALENRN